MTKPTLTDPTGRHSLDPKHHAVDLPARSFDRHALGRELSHLTTLTHEHRGDKVPEALEKAKTGGTDLSNPDGSAQAGEKTIEVSHDTIEGLTEKVRVHNPKAAEPAVEEITGIAASGGSKSGER